MTLPAKQVSVSINAPFDKVYNFISDPMNLPKWASGLSKSHIEKSGDLWVADSPMGKVKVRFAEKNKLGIVDHDVILPNGEVNNNPLRVMKNADGSEVVFTLFRQKGVTDQAYAKDAQTIESDLLKLKETLE